jgi:response regulator of citrate/malate metabolism
MKDTTSEFISNLFAARYFKLGKKIIIYIVSSSIDPSDIERARRIEVVSDFIIKPLTVKKFTEMVQQIV